MDILWLGYNGLTVLFADVVAVLHYQPALNGRITVAYGNVPSGVQTVVVTAQGDFFPSRWRVEQIRRSWSIWRIQQSHQ